MDRRRSRTTQRLLRLHTRTYGTYIPTPEPTLSYILELFTSLPAWPHEIEDTSLFLLEKLAHSTVSVRSCSGRLRPAFFDNAEEEVDCSETYRVLEIGEPPPINDYLLKMVQEYQSKEEKKKK